MEAIRAGPQLESPIGTAAVCQSLTKYPREGREDGAGTTQVLGAQASPALVLPFALKR